MKAWMQWERWRPRSRVAWATLVSLAGYGAAHLLNSGGFRFVFGLLLLFFGFYLGLRLLGSLQRRLLWRLRNRLLAVYVFVAVIPILLILGMVGLTAYMLYGQLAGYLIASDLESKAQQLGAFTSRLSAQLDGYPPPDVMGTAELLSLLEREHAGLQADFGGLVITVATGRQPLVVPGGSDSVACAPHPPWAAGGFRGVIASNNRLYLHSTASIPSWSGSHLCLTVPVNQALLAQVGTEIGSFSLVPLLEVSQTSSPGGGIRIGDRRYVLAAPIEPPGRILPPPRYLFDPVLNSPSKFDVVQWDPLGQQREEVPVLLSITSRPSLLNQYFFARLGEVGQALLTVLLGIGVVFLILQAVSLVTGVRLTRSITLAVHDLYGATQRVQAGDFSVRVPHRRDDQLGALGESFNQMAGSIQRLIEESKQRQRLENELEIARQVQEQLFPRSLPELKTLELRGLCLAARTVSGDYYDYGLTEPGKVILAIGDISGKGISAALLMATIQAILRSQVYASQLMGQLGQLNMAELVTRVNRQLCATTSMEKYSTLFVGLYDDNSRQLTYTNAGHLPPLVVGPGRTEELTEGGPVVGVFSHLHYDEATVVLRPGDWLVAYTDGLTEVENSYEEEYGSGRLTKFIQRRVQGASPESLIKDVLAEVEEWSPGIEQSDDRTMLVARAR